MAIKVIPLRTCRGTEEKAERLELLRRAFGPLGSLAHQNLVTVHDVGIEEEHSFLVMEYVQDATSPVTSPTVSSYRTAWPRWRPSSRPPSTSPTTTS
ncbi:MAG: hypothetical protein R2991_05825 [Thermoanaerobaculia bacterium]